MNPTEIDARLVKLRQDVRAIANAIGAYQPKLNSHEHIALLSVVGASNDLGDALKEWRWAMKEAGGE